MYNAGPLQGKGTVWNLSCTRWRLSGDLPMRPGETLSLTVTLPTFGKVKYGRSIADVLLPDGTNVNHTLVKDGRSWVKLKSAKVSRKSSTQHNS